MKSLVGDYPNNYLSFIPIEARLGSNHVVSQFDSNGGWVYHPNVKQPPDMFYPKILDRHSALQISYEPVQIMISKHGYMLNGHSRPGFTPVG
ncbi:hypothetical protein SAMN04487909_14514 [Aneurinibacillus migulanus]|nr:hypothetical protein SAMN04487909_14514 [Aneurinibacillus migulanus]